MLVVKTDNEIDYDDLMKEYGVSMFPFQLQGLGCLSGEHTIKGDKSVPPVIHPCCKVPFALHKPLKAELDRMENLEVIEKIYEPTEWV